MCLHSDYVHTRTHACTLIAPASVFPMAAAHYRESEKLRVCVFKLLAPQAHASLSKDLTDLDIALSWVFTVCR